MSNQQKPEVTPTHIYFMSNGMVMAFDGEGQQAPEYQGTATEIAPKLAGLGSLHFAVTTPVPESQAFFDQGLRLTYAFNHSEALPRNGTICHRL